MHEISSTVKAGIVLPRFHEPSRRPKEDSWSSLLTQMDTEKVRQHHKPYKSSRDHFIWSAVQSERCAVASSSNQRSLVGGKPRS